MSWSWGESHFCKSFRAYYNVFPGTFCSLYSVARVRAENLSLGVRAEKGASEASTVGSASFWMDGMLLKSLTSLVPLRSKLA